MSTLAPDSAVLEAGGIGYRIFCGPGTLTGLREGESVRLFTHHLVREDQQALYGFRTTEELGFFELLTTVTGVGPKVALAIVVVASRGRSSAGHPPGRRRRADGGVGRRQEARRAGHPRAQGEGVSGRRRGRHRGVPASSESEVVAALQALGYTASESRESARGAVAALPVGASLEDRVKAALRVLRRD